MSRFKTRRELIAAAIDYENSLAHYGVLGMKWGIRRYQPYPKRDGPKGKFVGKLKTGIERSKLKKDIRRARAETIEGYKKVKRRSATYDIASTIGAKTVNQILKDKGMKGMSGSEIRMVRHLGKNFLYKKGYFDW